jgi:Uma2 family endonuclease
MLWSASHSLNELEFKLDEYVANGAKLGFLIYPPQQQVFVYRPNQTPQCLQQPAVVPADPERPGFTLVLTEVWQ